MELAMLAYLLVGLCRGRLDEMVDWGDISLAEARRLWLLVLEDVRLSIEARLD